MQRASDRSADPHHGEATRTERPTPGDMLGEVIDLSGGLAVVLLPLCVTALPGILVFIIAPALLVLAVVAAPVALAAALVGPPYLLYRLVRRRRRDTP